ncbi:MAG: fibronectin type III domain-containing protein [Cellvibrionales bacterium]|jgi:hypothetical protein|nr:fibronectin type III domain-containing protein [Cellvibrionales bacterium]
MSSLINNIKDIPQHQPMAISAIINLRRLLQSLFFISLSTLLTACGDSANNNQQTNNTVAAKASDPTTESDTNEPEPETAPTAEFASADISLSWQIPLSREDGSALPMSAIAGYEINYENSRQQSTVITLNNAESNNYKINDLPPDDYQFSVFAFDTDNAISDASPLVTLQRTDFPRL